MRNCTTHHLACDCREARYQEMQAALDLFDEFCRHNVHWYVDSGLADRYDALKEKPNE